MTIILSIVFVIFLCNASGIKISNNKEIDSLILKQYMNSKGNERKDLEREIIKNIAELENITGNLDGITLKAVLGDVAGDENKDVIFIMKVSPKNTIVVVYEAVEDKYKYLGTVDNFFEVEALQIMPVKSGEKSLIIVREYADQMLGAYETNTFLRIYHWQNNKFELVLNLIEDTKAYWNEMWDNINDGKNKYWLSIKSSGEAVWKESEYPVVEIAEKQQYLKSEQYNSIDIPYSFKIEKQREINQKYYWSQKWQHFIMEEAKEKSTGEELAVLEDMGNNPFGLIWQNNTYRVKKKDGTIFFIEKGDVII